MDMEVTDSPREEDEAFVIEKTRAFNRKFTQRDVKPLCVFHRAPDGTIDGGLTAKTYWNYLEISFLWVSEDRRGEGLASKVMLAAETEALARGCRHAYLDTFSFQALGFYLKQGYAEFGRLSGFSGKHDRHFLYKALD